MKAVIKGNHAVSHATKLCRVQVISAYPITPQTSITEELAEMCAQGELNAGFIKVESEHSAMAALIGASSAGVRTFTATSSQGLLLMHEMLHWAAGAGLPIVMVNVNRAVGAPWNIWAEQTDSLSQRDTGWIQFYAESNQEALDSVIMAYRLAEAVSMPVMVSYDAFYLSHTSEVVDIPDIGSVDRFLPPYRPQVRLDIDDPRMFNGITSPEYYYEHRYVLHEHMRKVLEVYPGMCQEFEKIFGRSYDVVEGYRTDNAECIVVTAGTITSVTRLVVDKMRAEGRRVGLMKIRLFRPVPANSWIQVLGSAKKVVIIDRNLSFGVGGIFCDEVKAALYASNVRPLIYPFVAGLGGRDVTPKDIENILERVMGGHVPPDTTLFWGLKE